MPSSETVFFNATEDAEAEEEHAQKVIGLISQLKARLTETQYRHLWMYYALNMTVEEISAAEGTFRTTLRSYDSRASGGLQYPLPPGARGKYGGTGQTNDTAAVPGHLRYVCGPNNGRPE